MDWTAALAAFVVFAILAAAALMLALVGAWAGAILFGLAAGILPAALVREVAP